MYPKVSISDRYAHGLVNVVSFYITNVRNLSIRVKCLSKKNDNILQSFFKKAIYGPYWPILDRK